MVTVYSDTVEPSYRPSVNSLFIMCIGIIRKNSLIGRCARAESNPGQ